jgi:hypothetical protein
MAFGLAGIARYRSYNPLCRLRRIRLLGEPGALLKVDLVDEREANQFRAVVWRVETPQVTQQVTRQVTPEVLSLLAVMQGEMTRADIQKALELKDREHFRVAYLVPAVTGGLVEMTVPDKPQSRLQRYRLTATGQACLNALPPKE